MQNTKKKLFSITNLKKYFPIAKSSVFQKEKLYVKANEDVSIDIYEGETFGLVGESGCGKSTLGRVILQLYEQTSGNTLYYGRSREEIAPEYVKKTLSAPEKYLNLYKDAKAKADKITAQVEAEGENASFFLLQEKNLADANAKAALMNVTKILGGLITVSEMKEGATILLNQHNVLVKIDKLNRKLTDIDASIDIYESKIKVDSAESDEKTIKSESATLNAFRAKKAKIIETIKALRIEEDRLQKEIDAIRAKYKDDEEFQKYEAMLDGGIDLARLQYREIRRLRKDLQIVFQDPYSSLDPRMTIGQIIEEGLVTHKYFKHGSPKMKEYILKVMRDCGLQDYMLHRYPHQFSGGQRQRVCIARALAVKPKFVVCDECVSALDVSIQSQIINLLLELKEKEHLTYLFISHDLSVVRYISDRIGVMYLGNLVELASSETIFKDPRHPYTVALLSSIPTTDPDDLNKERIILEGNIPSPIRPPEGCKFHTRCFMACDKCKRVPPPLVEIEPGHFVACHFTDRKIDEEGNYLFDMPKMEKKSSKLTELELSTED
ncbi:MAG: ATP-binding cassette domain-containing protein [Clostridia bacterium]|nr:ATP-binding cassette domain-containing protein [Clostridia bacterium]MDY2901047.1 oligopeptide/dipeptide ABC transporter ATP-binding protein [Christensenellaceae bacterium]